MHASGGHFPLALLFHRILGCRYSPLSHGRGLGSWIFPSFGLQVTVKIQDRNHPESDVTPLPVRTISWSHVSSSAFLLFLFPVAHQTDITSGHLFPPKVNTACDTYCVPMWSQVDPLWGLLSAVTHCVSRTHEEQLGQECTSDRWHFKNRSFKFHPTQSFNWTNRTLKNADNTYKLRVLKLRSPTQRMIFRQHWGWPV